MEHVSQLKCPWTQSSVHCFEELSVSFTYKAEWVICFFLKDTVVSYITLIASFQVFPHGLHTLLVSTMRLGWCNECYRVWNPLPGCLCDSKPRYFGSLSRTGSARCTTTDWTRSVTTRMRCRTHREPRPPPAASEPGPSTSPLFVSLPLYSTITLFAVWSCRFA